MDRRFCVAIINEDGRRVWRSATLELDELLETVEYCVNRSDWDIDYQIKIWELTEDER